MIRDRLIICIASAWDYDPTSKHHVMRILSRHNDVLWVNYHGTRRPQANRSDARAVLSTPRRVTKGVSRISNSMWQCTPLVIPGARNNWLARTSQSMLVHQIRRAIRNIGGSSDRPIQLWTFAPDVPGLIGRFDEECSVYYCVDEFSAFEGVDKQYIRQAEQRTLDRADVVFATSQVLFDARKHCRPDAVLMRHGVDFDHFARAWRDRLPEPSDLADIPRPIFGFFGLIEHWIDTDLIARVAHMRPDYTFVFIGDVRTDVSIFRSLPNVHLLGRRSYNDLPAYANCFDAALLPFAQTAMTRNVNPIKMLEYLAAGLRVISTPLPEAVRYPNEILLAETPETFAYACDRALRERPQHPPAEIASAIASETWEARVRRINEVVTQKNSAGSDMRSSSRRDLLALPQRERQTVHWGTVPDQEQAGVVS